MLCNVVFSAETYEAVRGFVFEMSLSFGIFSYTFEKQFNKLTGLKLETQYFLSVFVLSTGITVVTFVPEWKVLDAKMLLIDSERGLRLVHTSAIIFIHLKLCQTPER